MPEWMKNALLAVFAVVVLTGAAVAVKDGGQSAQRSPSQPVSAGRAVPAARLRVVWLGDSFAEGTGAASVSQNFVSQVCAAKQWSCFNFAQGGTGYFANKAAKEFPQRRPIVDRARDAIGVLPDVVVVAAGLNDQDQPLEQVFADIDKTYSELRGRLPKAKIVAIGPFWPNGYPTASLLAVRDEVRAAASKVSATFIDPLEEHWVTGRTPVGGQPSTATAATLTEPDGTHPSQAGHDNIARRILADLKADGF